MSDTEPTCVRDAIERNDKEEWANAMAEEIKSLVDMDVFDVVLKPEVRKVMASRWLVALKKHSQGQIVRH